MDKTDPYRSTILIVDDQERNIQVVGTTLASFGFDFMIASSGEQAIERVKSKLPDLVLLDIVMAGMDGFEVCKAFGDIKGMEEVPVIFLSADDEKNTVVRALESGGVDYVTKPFNKAELLARVRTHLELKKTRDRLREILAKREEFVEVMAHDLKNWVGGANFSGQMLSGMSKELPEKALNIAGTITESTGKALDFIKEFLESARSSKVDITLKKEAVDLVSLCKETFTHYEHAAIDKGIEFTINLPSDPVYIESDRIALLRIVDNLTSNALKFSPPNSKVSVDLKSDPLVLSITDSGPGFSEEDRENLFEPFTRLTARPTGGEISTGLGLSVVKQLADSLGIQIDIKNVDPGAKVSLKFAPETVR